MTWRLHTSVLLLLALPVLLCLVVIAWLDTQLCYLCDSSTLEKTMKYYRLAVGYRYQSGILTCTL